MPWLIKTKVAKRLATFFKLVSPPKRIYVYPTVMPTENYSRIMKENIYIYLLTAGNVITSIECLDDEELSILYGLVYIDNDATVANRNLRLMVFYPDDSTTSYILFDFPVRVANDNTNYRFNKENIVDYTNIDANNRFYHLPNPLIEGGTFRFYYVTGQAGDQISFRIKLQSVPNIKEYLQE